MNKLYQYKTTPVANEKAVVSGEKYRFTVLTSRLIRIEYSENGYFEDRATQTIINRIFDVPEFSVEETDGVLVLTTDHIELTYDIDSPFEPTTLTVSYTGKNSKVKAGKISTVWNYGTCLNNTLGGTARTLDQVDGACELESGIMSRGTVTVLDDSNTLIIEDDGTITPKKEETIDQYLFCYGDSEKIFDYKAALCDFYKLTGNTPLLPRFALGNWWSRYYAYTQEEYTELMKRFKAEDIPFSVAVLDMDWHNVIIDPKYGTGWTGYSWNKDLFPDHKAFLKGLSDEGLEVSLNLHPQEGVAAHEDAYEKMAEAMGIDPKTEKCVPFEIENPEFIENYFKYLHHPLEKEGVRFWWMDWQQGNTTRVKGLDPLWMLNHYHYIDNTRNGNRGMAFSRYAGPGSHRYPIGFSGDTYISWESLDFQPYFTATASNIGYGWWSHDIGGHDCGQRDDELTTRWFQFGTFSPINRLHSSNIEFLGKEPWKYNKISELSMKKFLKLRHELIPYLYSMNYRAAEFAEPLIKPLYYEYPCGEAFEFKNEYLFGTEMIVSPITSPHDDKTTMGSVKTYIPEGIWYDFFNNMRYSGDRTLTLFRTIDEYPVLVKAGGIIPIAKLTHVNDIENPENMKIKVFAGNSNSFDLYEDDGNTFAYKDGEFAITKMELKWSKNPEFIINSPKGEKSVVPSKRNFELEFIGFDCGTDITVAENDTNKEFTVTSSNGVVTINVSDVGGKLVVNFNNQVKLAENNTYERLYSLLERIEKTDNLKKLFMLYCIQKKDNPNRLLCDLMQIGVDEKILLAMGEIITAEY